MGTPDIPCQSLLKAGTCRERVEVVSLASQTSRKGLASEEVVSGGSEWRMELTTSLPSMSHGSPSTGTADINSGLVSLITACSIGHVSMYMYKKT